MNKKEFKQMLNLESLKIDIEMSEKLKNTNIPKKEEYLYQTKKTSIIPKFISIFACFILCVFCVSVLFVNKAPETAEGITSYIMEINPSICITTDKDDNIIKVCALNGDANAIVLDEQLTNIEGKSFDDGIDKLMTVIKNNGFFDNYDEVIRIYAFNDSNECQYNRLNHFEELMKRKMVEFGYNISFEKHRLGMDDFKEKVGFEEEYQTLNDMTEFFRHKEKCYIPPQ